MATKTISLDMEAYEKLRGARIRPNESFSQVIKRGHWETPPSTGAALLRAMQDAPLLDDEALARLEAAQKADQPPDASWTE